MVGNAKRWLARVATLAVVLVMALGMVGLEGMIAPTAAQAKTGVAMSMTVAKKASTKRKAIGSKKALAIALKNARIKKSQAKRLKVGTDREDGRKVYEVEFRYGKYEYEYDIDYYTGKIIDKDVERYRK